MYPRSFGHFRLPVSLCLICASLLMVPLLVIGAGQDQPRGARRAGRPKPGKPEGVLPNLDEIQNESQLEREAPPPIPSTIRSQKNSGKPWDGRRVGDPDARRGLDQAVRTERGSAGSDLARNKTRRAHARGRMHTPPPVPDNQFVQNFFTWALERNPTSAESTYWHDQLRVAYGQGQTSLKLAAIELGRTLFESAAYAARNRQPAEYVSDLYKTYLMREPDVGGWTMWKGLVPSHGPEYVRRGFEESGEFATLIANMTPNGLPTSNAASLISARVDPRNQPGNGMLTRDVSWNVPLLSLRGTRRAGSWS